MKKNFLIKKITVAGVVAAIYAVMTIAVAPLSYGPIQLRFAEALTALPLLTPYSIWGLFAGCLIANIYTGSIIDIVFGSLTTLAAAFLTYKTRKTPWLAMFFPVLLNAVIVGGYIYLLGWAENGMGIIMCILSVGAGQAVACYAIGMPLYYILKNKNIVSEL